MKNDLTTPIPDTFINNCGDLIKEGLDILSAPGLVDIIQYNLPVLISALSAAISGKISIAGYWPNTYQAKIGKNASGKSESANSLFQAIADISPNMIGPSKFSAGAAFISYLSEKSSRVVCHFDEIGWLLRSGGNGSDSSTVIDKDKKEIITELYTAAGVRRYEKWYTNVKDRREIVYPCLSIVGNTTTDTLSDIHEADFKTGFLTRWMIYRYDGPNPYRGYSLSNKSGNGIKELAAKIASIKKIKVPGVTDIAAHTGDHNAVALGMTAEAIEYMTEKSRKIISMSNSDISEAEAGIYSRSFEHLHKLVMIVAASKRGLSGGLYDDITLEDIIAAEALSDDLASWKVKTLLDNLSVGQFHDNTVVLLDAIDMAVKHGQNPTYGVIKSKKREIKNWSKFQFEQIINSLIASDEVEATQSGRKTAYYRCK